MNVSTGRCQAVQDVEFVGDATWTADGIATWLDCLKICHENKDCTGATWDVMGGYCYTFSFADGVGATVPSDSRFPYMSALCPYTL